MGWNILLPFCILIVLAGVALLFRFGGQEVRLVARPLMTERERRVIQLIEAARPDCRVHAQVAMAALVDAPKSIDPKRRTAMRNRFDRKIVDYVLEDRATGKVVAIIELDDRTHKATKDRARDAMTESAGYRTLRLPAGERINVDVVRELLARLSRPSTPTSPDASS